MSQLEVVGGLPEGKSEDQPFLFSKETIAELTEAEKRGEYTLERLRQLRPEVIDEIIRLRGQWCGKMRIAKICRVHHKTVAAVDAAYPEAIQDEQQKRVKRLRSAADKLVELVDDNPESVPANVRCLAASQLLDKAELLDGRATLRLEHTERVDIFSDWPEVIKSFVEQGKHAPPQTDAEKAAWKAWCEKHLPSENPIDIETTNVPAEIGSDGQKKPPISDSPAPTIMALPSSGSEPGEFD